jgi:multiple sugar transport system permease protein
MTSARGLPAAGRPRLLRGRGGGGSDERGRFALGARQREALVGYLFILPTMVGFAVFILGPMIYGLGLSFFSWDLFTPAKFVGLANFRRFFHDHLAYRTLLNTALFATGAEALNISLGLLIAVGLNRMRSARLSAFLRSCYFLPFIMSTAVAAVLWNFLLQPDLGVVNYEFHRIGLPRLEWLNSSSTALPTVILIDVWKNVGFFVIVFLTGLQGIPRELYDAARVDGAGAWTTFRNITLPLLSPSIFFALVIAIIGASQVFDSIYVLTNGGPGDSTRTILMYVYNEGFGSLRMGYAACLSLVLFVIVLALTTLQIRGAKRWVFYK